MKHEQIKIKLKSGKTINVDKGLETTIQTLNDNNILTIMSCINNTENHLCWIVFSLKDYYKLITISFKENKLLWTFLSKKCTFKIIHSLPFNDIRDNFLIRVHLRFPNDFLPLFNQMILQTFN